MKHIPLVLSLLLCSTSFTAQASAQKRAIVAVTRDLSSEDSTEETVPSKKPSTPNGLSRASGIVLDLGPALIVANAVSANGNRMNQFLARQGHGPIFPMAFFVADIISIGLSVYIVPGVMVNLGLYLIGY